MSNETDFLDGFVFAHGNVLERARAKFGTTGSAFYPGCGKQNPDISQAELTWIRKETDLYNEELDKYIDIKRRHIALQKKVGKQLNLGPREFTLTYSPQWGWDDEEARSHMRTAIQRLQRYYSASIVEFRAIGEVCKDGKSHVHCFYRLSDGCKITDKNFSRAYPKWNAKIKCGPTGHQGGHHANVRDEASFKGYIEKDHDTAWLDILWSPDPSN